MARATVTLESGWGYWDVTSLPYGGSFHRLTTDAVGEVLEQDGYKLSDIVVSLNGRTIVITRRAIKANARYQVVPPTGEMDEAKRRYIEAAPKPAQEVK